MRNHKVLWAIICLLMVSVLILVSSMIFLKTEAPEQNADEDMNSNKKREHNERIIASIGDRSITYQELQINLVQRYGQELLNQLIDREAIKQEGKALGIIIAKQQMDDELKRMQQGYGSEEQFYESMKEQLGLSKKELYEDVYYKLMLEQIVIYDIHIGDEEVEEYLAEHADEFEGQVQFHIQQIIVSTIEEAQDIVSKLQGGADFEQLARERSLDEATSSSGGDLGFVGEGDPFVLPSIIEKANLMNVNEISQPIRLEEGYAIIKLKERIEPRKQDQEQLREIVRKELALNEALPLREVVDALRKKRNAEILDSQLK